MPIKFGNTHYYRIAGRYIFSGELVIVRGAIYFFPEADMSDQRNKIAENLPHKLSLAALALVYLVQKVSLYASGIDDLSRTGISNEQFRENAEVRIAKAKEFKSTNFTESLPLPTFIRSDEISGMRLSSTGRLSLSAQSDNHDFNVGLPRRGRLRDVLWEMDVGRV